MTHGLTDAQFLNTVASFLGPYYIVLALMNGIAALYLWRMGTAKTWFNIRAGGQEFPFQRDCLAVGCVCFRRDVAASVERARGVDAVDARVAA